MTITGKTILKIVLGIGLFGLLLFALIIFSILYESKKDVSNELPYSKVLNIPQEVKQVSTIRWYDTNNRFQHHSLVVNEESYFDRDDLKSVKIY